MDTLFENRYFSNHRMLAEFLRKHMIGPRPPAVVLLVVAFALFVIRAHIYDVFLEMLPMLFFLAVIFTGVYFLPDWYAWMSHRHAKKQNDGVLPETIITFGDHIELREGMVHYTIEYRKLVRVVHLKHSYVLFIGKRNGLMLDPDSFTKGTF